MKKLTCMLLALLMLLTAVPSLADNAEFPEHLSITWLGQATSKMHTNGDGLIASKLGELFNIDITTVKYTCNVKEDMTVYYNSGEMADHMLTTEANLPTVIDQELVRLVPISLIKEYAPHWWQCVMDNYPGLLSTMAYDAETDSLYGIPSGMGEFYTTYMIRKDWLDNLGLSMPTTLEEFEEVCRAFTEDDPDKNGENDTFALCLQANEYANVLPLAYAFNTSLPSSAVGRNKSSFYLTEDGTGVVKGQITENYRSLLKYLRNLYEKGYIYTDLAVSFNDAGTLASDGKIGIMAAGTTHLMKLYVPNGWYALMYQKNPNAEGTVMPYLKGSTAEKQSTGWRYHCFGDTCTDEKLIRILQIFEREVTDLEFAKLIWLGEEGVTYNIEESGIGKLTPEYSPAEKQAEAGIKYFITNFRTDDLKALTFGPEYKELLKYQDIETYNELVPSGVSFAAVKEYGADLTAIEMEYYANVLAGNLNTESDWDEYVNKWLNAGGQKVLDEVYEFYKAHN